MTIKLLGLFMLYGIVGGFFTIIGYVFGGPLGAIVLGGYAIIRLVSDLKDKIFI